MPGGRHPVTEPLRCPWCLHFIISPAPFPLSVLQSLHSFILMKSEGSVSSFVVEIKKGWLTEKSMLVKLGSPESKYRFLHSCLSKQEASGIGRWIVHPSVHLLNRCLRRANKGELVASVNKASSVTMLKEQNIQNCMLLLWFTSEI